MEDSSPVDPMDVSEQIETDPLMELKSSETFKELNGFFDNEDLALAALIEHGSVNGNDLDDLIEL